MKIKNATRTRLAGYVGIMVAALLTPAGKIISSAVAAATVVGLLTENPPDFPKKAKAGTPAVPLIAQSVALPVAGGLFGGAATASGAPGPEGTNNVVAHNNTSSVNLGLTGLADTNQGDFGRTVYADTPNPPPSVPARDPGPGSKNPYLPSPALPGGPERKDCEPTKKSKDSVGKEAADQPAAHPAVIKEAECEPVDNKPGAEKEKSDDGEGGKPDSNDPAPKVIEEPNPSSEIPNDPPTIVSGGPGGKPSPDDMETIDPAPKVIEGPNPSRKIPNDPPTIVSGGPDVSPSPGREPISPEDVLPPIEAFMLPEELLPADSPFNEPIEFEQTALQVTAVPEPSTLGLLILGLLSFGWASRKKYDAPIR